MHLMFLFGFHSISVLRLSQVSAIIDVPFTMFTVFYSLSSW